MKMPTQAELDATPVDDSDLVEWTGYVLKLEDALHRARIPLTADWSLVLLRFAAQSCVIQGMPRAFFDQLCDHVFEFAADGNRDPTIVIDLASIELTWSARVNRLHTVFMRAGFVKAGPEVLYGQLMLAARTLYCVGADLPQWQAECARAWAHSEQAIVAHGKRTQA